MRERETDAAVGTDTVVGVWAVRVGWRGRGRVLVGRGDGAEELTAAFEVSVLDPVREEPVAADLHEAGREEMEEEAAEEGGGGERLRLHGVAPPAVAVAERDAVTVVGDDPAVVDSDAVDVAGDVLEEDLRPGEGRLRVDDPTLARCSPQRACKAGPG